MESKQVNEAIYEYYKLKENYENKLNQNKSKIINNTLLTTKEKEQKFKQLKKQCINCKGIGGTIFSNKNGILKAVCGNVDKPCALNIEIKKGTYKLSNELVESLISKINQIKIDIIKINFLTYQKKKL